MNSAQEDIQALQERNRRVEADKAWETSLTRRSCIALTTYVFACIFLKSINVQNFALSAIVPTAGYVLSTLSLPRIKKQWLKKIYANGDS